jgi:transcriptional regulator with XRE-family HTH domain
MPEKRTCKPGFCQVATIFGKLAPITVLDRTYISGVERGVRNPTVLVLSELAQALKVPPARLLEAPKH